MALGKVINSSRRPVDLADGRTLGPGEVLDGVDIDHIHNRQLMLDGHLYRQDGPQAPSARPVDRTSKTFLVAGPDEGVIASIHGHSYSASDVASSGAGTRWTARLNRRRGWGSLTNRAVNGHTSIDQEVVMGGNGSGKWTTTPNLPFIAFIMCITNDLLQGGADARAILGFKHALRSMIQIMRSGTRIESSAMTTTGTWATGTSADYSGGTNIRTTEPGATASAPFTGTEVTVMVYAFQDDANAFPAFQVRVDGVLKASGTVSNQAKTVTSGKLVHQAVRITGLAAGAHTVEVRHAGSAGQTLHVDMVLTPSANVGTIVLIKEGQMNPGGAYPNYSDGNLKMYHEAVEAIAAEYPSDEVFTVDLWEAGWDVATMAGTDGVHPNDLGMDFIADTVSRRLDEKLTYRRGLVVL